MRDDVRQLLQEHLDGTVAPERADEVKALLRDDAEARRYVAAHRRLWDFLGEALADEPEASRGFRDGTWRRARSDVARLRTSARIRTLAASLLVGLVIVLWYRSRNPEGLDPADRDVVRYLHVLEDYELLDEYAWEIDLRGELDVLEAFDGELEGEG